MKNSWIVFVSIKLYQAYWSLVHVSTVVVHHKQCDHMLELKAAQFKASFPLSIHSSFTYLFINSPEDHHSPLPVFVRYFVAVKVSKSANQELILQCLSSSTLHYANFY